MTSEITDRISIGNWQGAKAASLTHYIITVATDAPFVGHEHYHLVDGPGNDPAIFEAAVNATALAVRTQPKPVMVHCVSGRSRSAAVIAGALTKLDRSLCGAIDLLFAKHDQTRIHPHMSKLLLELT